MAGDIASARKKGKIGEEIREMVNNLEPFRTYNDRHVGYDYDEYNLSPFTGNVTHTKTEVKNGPMARLSKKQKETRDANPSTFKEVRYDY